MLNALHYREEQLAENLKSFHNESLLTKDEQTSLIFQYINFKFNFMKVQPTKIGKAKFRS